jgi:membrane protease YdiL (CAAX protease family)
LAVRLRLAARTRLWLGLELLLLFFGVPALVVLSRELGVEPPLVPILLVVTLTVALGLSRDPHFDPRVLRVWRGLATEGRRILWTFVGCAVLLSLYTAWAWPGELLELPRERPRLWALVLVAYPVLSVYPQELLYRAYFFHRYARVLPDARALVGVSALAFGYLHIVYGAWLSVLLTTIGGVLFGITYLRTRSVLLVGIEHALYGCFLFTVGLGQFFYRQA